MDVDVEGVAAIHEVVAADALFYTYTFFTFVFHEVVVVAGIFFEFHTYIFTFIVLLLFVIFIANFVHTLVLYQFSPLVRLFLHTYTPIFIVLDVLGLVVVLPPMRVTWRVPTTDSDDSHLGGSKTFTKEDIF